MKKLFASFFISLFFCFLSSSISVLAQPTSGTALVIDPVSPLLFSVDVATGARSIISDFSNVAQGPTGCCTFDNLTLDGSGNALVIAYFAPDFRGALFSVDLATGIRTIISDFGNAAQGPLGIASSGVALDGSGNALITDFGGGTNGRGALFSVDLATGIRTIISDFGNAAQGPLGGFSLSDVIIDGNGNALITDPFNGGTFAGALYSVDLATGARTIISDFGNAAQGPLVSVFGISLGGSGTIYAAGGPTAGGPGALYSIDLATGARTIISDFGNAAQGPLGASPHDVALDGSGNALVADQDAAPGGFTSGVLFGIDLATGTRTIVSDFSNAAQGPQGVDPNGVAYFPDAFEGVCSTLGDDRFRFLPDIDVFQFEGTKDEIITVTLDIDPDGDSEGNKATLSLFNKIGHGFIFKTDAGSLPNEITVKLKKNGPYWISVGEQLKRNSFVGDYCITVESDTGENPELIPTASVE